MLFDKYPRIYPAVLERMPVAESKARSVVTTDLEKTPAPTIDTNGSQKQQGSYVIVFYLFKCLDIVSTALAFMAFPL